MKRSRALIALMPLTLAASLLTSCSAGSTSAVNGVDCAPEGSVSESLQVSGKFGASDVALKNQKPVSAKSLEATTLIQGEGAKVKANDAVEAQLSVFNGADGKVISQSSKTSLVVDKEKLQPWILQIAACSTVGDRVAAVAPASEVLGQNAQSMGLKSDDTLVMVFDMLSADKVKAEPGTLQPGDLLKKAEGEPQPAEAGLPSVKLAEDGSPTIIIPEGIAAPAKLTVETLIKGSGEEVKEGDRVYVHYRGVIWRTGEEFDSSWKRGAPIDFTTSGVIPGFSKALVGQTVGSQVMSIVPAEDGGYGAAGLQQQGHEPDDVMVFVLDILGTVHAE